MLIQYAPKSYIKPINIPGSKSITNRLLVLKHLYFPALEISNASKSSDSEVLDQLLNGNDHNSEVYHVEDGGTTLRFLLCVLVVTNNKCQVTCGKKLITRPHDELINALNRIGFNIAKTDSGFIINPIDLSTIQDKWSVDISKSSQFASALLLVAPFIGRQIEITLIGNAVSKGYLELTLSIMQDLGIKAEFISNELIRIQPFGLVDDSMIATVESDWSGISYFILLSKLTGQQLTINNVNQNSIQPDRNTLKFANLIGVMHTFEDDTLILQPISNFETPKEITRDYTNCPDLAPTEIVGCFALGIDLKSTGNSHLQYKESNRSLVVNQELNRFSDSLPHFQTHNDHRIAMSLAGLSVFKPIELDDIDVVSKSFPDFWQEVSKLGIHLKLKNG